MTEEQKMQWLKSLIESGANVAQINLGDGYMQINNYPSQESNKNIEKHSSQTKIDESREDELSKTNDIVITEIDKRTISLYLLHKHIEKVFGSQFKCKYDWVAVWQWMKAKGLLVKGHRTYEAFAQQWSKEPWHVAGAEPCKAENLRYYSVVDDVAFEKWETITEKTRTSIDGFRRLKKLYLMLEDGFEIDQILK